MRRALRQDHLLADSCSALIDDELLVTVDVPRLDDTCAGFPVGIDQTTRIRLLFPRMCREHRSWKNGFIREGDGHGDEAKAARTEHTDRSKASFRDADIERMKYTFYSID